VRSEDTPTVTADDYDAAYMAYNARQYESGSRHTRMRLDNVRMLVQPQAGDRVLELGCATGAMAEYLAGFGCQIVGVDYADAAIEAATRLHPGIEFVQADATDLPFPDGSFDKVLAADITEHLDDATLDACFAEAFRVLDAGGALAIHTPNPLHIMERAKARHIILKPDHTHIGLRTSKELERRLRDAGFTVELSTWRPSFIPVFRWAEMVVGRFGELGRYRICLRARKH